jgi:hypothetical protein
MAQAKSDSSNSDMAQQQRQQQQFGCQRIFVAQRSSAVPGLQCSGGCSSPCTCWHLMLHLASHYVLFIYWPPYVALLLLMLLVCGRTAS